MSNNQIAKILMEDKMPMIQKGATFNLSFSTSANGAAWEVTEVIPNNNGYLISAKSGSRRATIRQSGDQNLLLEMISDQNGQPHQVSVPLIITSFMQEEKNVQETTTAP